MPKGTICIIAKESVVQKTEMEAMGTSVTKEVKPTVATASVNDVNSEQVLIFSWTRTMILLLCIITHAAVLPIYMDNNNYVNLIVMHCHSKGEMCVWLIQ